MSNSNQVPSEATFSLVLSKELNGKPVLENPICTFNYIWDFKKNMGIATLQSINGTPVNITLHPLGIEGYLDFMSDITPARFTVSVEPGQSIALIEVVICRVILDIDRSTGAQSAAIMFNEDGSSIQGTKNFEDASSRMATTIAEHA